MQQSSSRTSHSSPFRLLRTSAGQGLAEYIIVAVLIAIIVLLGIRYFGSGVSNQFQNATQEINTAADETKGTGPSANGVEGQSAAAKTIESHESNINFQENSADKSPAGNTSERGNGGGSGAGGSDLDSQVSSLRNSGVGTQEHEVVRVIHINWQLVGFLAAICIALGIFMVLRQKKGIKKVTQGPKKKKKSKFRRDGGQAMVEFLFASITFLFVTLGVIQLAMVINAQSLVRYAAYNAARAGVVNASDPTKMKEQMQEAARVSLLAIFPRHGRADHLRGLVENYLGAKDTDQDASLTYFHEPITEVKVLPRSNAPSGSVVTFDDVMQSDKSVITVQVVHRYELVIPLVNRILFYLYTRYRSGEGYQGQTADYLASITDKMRRTGEFKNIEYRIPLVAHYTMRLQSDYVVP